MWDSSNSSLVRPSITAAPAATATSTSWVSAAVRRAEVGDQRPAVEVDDALDVRRPVGERRQGVLDEGGLVGYTQRAVVAALEADRRGGLEVESEPPQSEPPRWPGQTLTSSPSGSRRSWSERKTPTAPSRGSTARSGRATSRMNSESPASSARARRHGRRRAAGRRCARAGGRGVDRLDRHLVELQHPAVGEGLMWVFGSRQLVDVDGRPGRPREPAVAGDVVGVGVSLEHVLDADAVQAGKLLVGIDVPLGSTTAATPASRSATR